MTAHRFEDEWIVKAAAAAAGAEAVERAREARWPRLDDGLLRNGVTAEALCAAVAETLRLRAQAAAPKTPDRLAVSLLPEKICRRHRVAPLRLADEAIELATDDPLDLEALADVRAVTGREPVPVYMPPAQLDALLARAFDPEFVVYDLLERFEEPTTVEIVNEGGSEDLEHADVRGPVIRLANMLLARAVIMRASDVHIEHDERQTTIRMRVDGSLRNFMTVPRHVGAGPLVSRVKIMASLDISDRLRPQDGRAKLRIGTAEVGLRVSTLPTSYGEKVVIRVLDKRAAEVPFEKLGFRPKIASKIAELTDAPQGFFLVTGPTGSGKTTSLYSVLNRLKREDTNIVTVEDPIEYKLDGVNQVQVQEKQGLTFAAILRSVLRQDPDVILVGEIRDRETADIALQAAQTGHIVFSTLHTNDTISAIARLADMGVERFKLVPSLLGVTAQRLVRRLCDKCREERPAAEIPAPVRAAMDAAGVPVRAWKARGCADCDFVGFRGRVALVELLETPAELRDRIGAGDDDAALRSLALSKGWLLPLAHDAAARISDGTTTLEEASTLARFDPAASSAAPAAPAGAPVPAATAAAARPAAAEGRKRVLVADDDAAIRVIVKTVLEKAGYAVTDVVDGAKALEAVAAQPPDLLVVDMHMPSLDGRGVIRGIRQGLGITTLPIVVLTADEDDKSQEEALALGADDYVLKPVKPGVLAARVAAAFRRAAL